MKKHIAVGLVYHRIVESYYNNYLYKGPSVHHDLKDFRREMAFISKWFRIISLNELADHLKNRNRFTAPTIILTFDDGYRDNYTLAYPILKKYNLPATIYLISGLIETNKRTWPDEIEYALLNTKVNMFVFPSLFGEEVIDISSLERRRKVNIRMAEALKEIANSKKMVLIDELFHKLKVERIFDDNDERRMLNWEEIKEMSKNNISFAAHTVSHPILTQISPEEARWEIKSSKTAIEEKTELKIKHFGFSNGMKSDFSEELKEFCIDIGFETISTAEYGFIDSRSDPYFIRRFMPDIPIHFFAGEIVKLFIFSYKYNNNNNADGKRK
jgi:peptidoglycan/xylan/chitin deacetylase (PgdA/CDA1 family)